MKPADFAKVQYPGDVVSASGLFRVRHSTAHYPETESYLYGGLCLPDCTMLGCHVTYRMIQLISLEDHFGKNPRILSATKCA
jgi:hypothetical protein